MSSINNRIGWKTASFSPGVASVRYRAILPMLALADAGVESKVFDGNNEDFLDGLDFLIIVKSFTATDVMLAQSASARGVRVIFDLCDNIFIGGYGSKSGAEIIQIFQAISAFVDCIVTTTEPLAEKIQEILPGMRVEVIPDGIETPELFQRGVQLLQQAQRTGGKKRFMQLKNDIQLDIRRIKNKGLRAVLPIGKNYAKRLICLLRERVRVLRESLGAASLREASSRPSISSASPLRIVWFGTHGAPYANFGMLDLLEIKDALEVVAREFHVELIVISNNYQKYQDHIRPLAIESRYVEWSPSAVKSWLEVASVVVVPNTLDPFSICKSANRTVLAVTHGVPVVATPTPALRPLADYIYLGRPLLGLRRYLGNKELGVADAAGAAIRSQQEYGQATIARYWIDLLLSLNTQAVCAVQEEPELILALHLVQDIDLAAPVMEAIRSKGLVIEAWCSISLMRKSPRVLSILHNQKFSFRIIDDDVSKTLKFPSRARVLMTVTETNLGPHRFSRRLSELAIDNGLFVSTMQHGFENVGLTYSDATHAIEHINFLAQRIYTWGPLTTLHSNVSTSVRSRCMPVGCPKPAFPDTADLSKLIDPSALVIGVFENLHWHRYDDNYRADFVAGVSALAEQFPHIFFLVKPHHAGLWLTRRYQGRAPSAANIVIADPQSGVWEKYTASDLLGRVIAVITTPSTVALDAARRGIPVSVIAGDLDLSNYTPLLLIRQAIEWTGFVQRVLDESERKFLISNSIEFTERVLVSGDAAACIASNLTSLVSGGR